MTTMLDKCAVAGDITQGIDRRGVWTAAITVIGGTSGTAVKLVSCDTVNGEYTDYKTLISAADAETDQYKGFVVDLHGAKKFIKVTGAVMATAVFGDCDHDVKNIAITEGEVPSGADLENNHEVTITENGEIEITPATGKDGMKKVTATVNVTGGGGGNTITLYYCKDKKAMIGLLNIVSEGVAVLPNQWDDLQYVEITPVKGDRVINNVSEIKYLKNSGYASYSKIDGASFDLWETYGVPYTYTIVPGSLEYSKLSVQYSVGAERREIDVSSIAQETYTEVFRPSEDGTAMSSLELVLTGIPTGGGVTKLYAWYSVSDFVYTTTPTPSVGDKVILSSDSSTIIETQQVYSVTEEGITIYDYEEATVYARYPRGDVNLV